MHMQKRAWAAAAALLVMIIFGPSWAMAYFIEGFDPVPVPAPPGISGPASPAPGSSGSRETITVSSIGYKMVYLEPGTFMMGSPSSEPGRHGGETRHRVTLTKGFYIGATEVTQGQWKKMMGSNPSENPGDDCPVEQVSWEDCQQFIQKLNRLEGTDKYRLPTEAEWEYACRAGSETAYCFGSGAGQLDQYAWYDDNSRGRAHPVGLKKPNAWGLYDMHGNVLEWCQDWYDGGIYPSGSVTDPTGPSSGIWLLLRAPPRVCRGGSWGGSWNYDAKDCRSAVRYTGSPGDRYDFLGLRLARDL